MALQIRRGSEQARTGITFANGEIVWVSDRRKLYIGDGATAGGTHVLEHSVDGSHGLVFDQVTQTLQVDRPIPSIAGQTGKFLSTDGSSIFWDDGQGGGAGSVVTDTSPQLGGNLSLNSHNITGTGSINITGNATVTGTLAGNNAEITHSIIAGSLTTDIVNTNDAGVGLQIQSHMGNSLCVNYYSGTAGSPTAVPIDGPVGALSIKGFNGSEYQFAGALVAFWEAGTNTNSPYPASTVRLVAGNNSSDPVFATLNSAGTFSATVLQTGSFNGSSHYPASPTTGMIIFDTTNNHFYGYNGSLWKQLDN